MGVLLVSLRKRKRNSMDQALIDSVIAEHGPWTAHNIQLGVKVQTMHEGDGLRYKARCDLYKFLFRNSTSQNISDVRVLDLGCLEGGIGIEFALQGATVKGIDVRRSNIAKCQFASDMLGISTKCSWVTADVCDSTLWHDIGQYDLIICSGLLYHLDGSSIIPLLHNLSRSVSKDGIVILDTNIASRPISSLALDNDNHIFGCTWEEHNPSASYEDRLKSSWSSLENDQAFWLTERSLTNALVLSGFKYVFKSLYPYHEWGHQSRDVWIAKRDVFGPLEMPLKSEPDTRPIDHPGLI